MFQMQMRVQSWSSVGLSPAAGTWTLIRVFLCTWSWLMLRPVAHNQKRFHLGVNGDDCFCGNIRPTGKKRNLGVEPRTSIAERHGVCRGAVLPRGFPLSLLFLQKDRHHLLSPENPPALE